MSDGTNQIRFIDPDTFQVLRTISVLYRGRPLTDLNELEYIKGEIFANVWRTNIVVRIDPATGDLLGAIDFSRLLASGDYGPGHRRPQWHRPTTPPATGFLSPARTGPSFFEVQLGKK